MNNKHGRVLAYSLAKEISNQDLEEVSGGTMKTCTRQTFKVTGTRGNMESFFDVVIDF